MYRRWVHYLNPAIELEPVEMAGRGRRIEEPLYIDLEEAVQDALACIRPIVGDTPYALFGHSLGGLICYELAHLIRRLAMPAPRHIFFSGKSAPHVKREDEKVYHKMGKEEFRRELLELGGTDPAFFEDPGIMEIFLPVLKNDFKLAEMETHRPPIVPLDQPITVLLGKDDDQTAEQCDGWKIHTAHRCTIHYFEGGHFFLQHQERAVVQIINETLRNTLCDTITSLKR